MLKLEVETVGQRGLTEVSEMSGAYRFASRRHWGDLVIYLLLFFCVGQSPARARVYDVLCYSSDEKTRRANVTL